LIEAQELRRVRIVGVGFGARLALETALQTAERGVQVETLTLIDCITMVLPVDLTTLDRLFDAELGLARQRKALLSAATASGSAVQQAWPGDDVIDDATQFREVFRHTLLGSAEHRGSPYIGNVALIGATPEHPEVVSERVVDWEKLCIGEVMRVELQGRQGRCVNCDTAFIASVVRDRGDRGA
jgi:pimeloyl-ACP methyl ester carboxylesterase